MIFRVGLIGKGHVGTSLLELFNRKKNLIEKRLKSHIVLTAVFNSKGALINQKGLDPAKIIGNNLKVTKMKEWQENISVIDNISKENFDILIETTPTNVETGEPATTHIFKALNHKIDVITSNKGPLFLYYTQLKSLAEKNMCFLKFDATVACFLPIISIKKLLLGSEITHIKAILNGTSNFILSQMSNNGLNFTSALQYAQKLGYTESDPNLDIHGLDAAGKIVILANELLDWKKTIKDVQIEGISDITLQKIKTASVNGCKIKLISVAKNNELYVKPCLIKPSSLLNLDGNLNGILLQTKHGGPIILIGNGAGSFEAASAIINNLIEIIDNKEHRTENN
jgi:homoserine dehydrogenase